MWAKKKSWKERWLIVPLLPRCQLAFCQQRIHERWKPLMPLAQIPLCTHKCRNSSKITKKQELFPSSWPQEFSRIRREEVWRSLLHLFIRALRGSLCGGLCVCKCVHMYLCVCAKGAERWRRSRELIRNLCLCFLCLGCGAADESEWRWRCGCRCLHLYLSVEGLLCPYYGWVRRASPLKNSSTVMPAWCQLGGSEQTYASLRKILMKVHIDAIN